jgi:hypothetical protein
LGWKEAADETIERAGTMSREASFRKKRPTSALSLDAAVLAHEGDGVGDALSFLDVGPEPTRLGDDQRACRAARRVVAREALLDIRVCECCGEFNCVVAGPDGALRNVRRATNAASPRSATRWRIIGDSRSPISWKSGWAHVRTISAKIGGASPRHRAAAPRLHRADQVRRDSLGMDVALASVCISASGLPHRRGGTRRICTVGGQERDHQGRRAAVSA